MTEKTYHLSYDDHLTVAGRKWACVFPCSVRGDIDGHPQLASGEPVTDEMILIPQEPKYRLGEYTQCGCKVPGLTVVKYFLGHDRTVLLFQDKQYLKVIVTENHEYTDETYLAAEEITWSDLEHLGEVTAEDTATYDKMMSDYHHQKYAYDNILRAAANLKDHGHRFTAERLKSFGV